MKNNGWGLRAELAFLLLFLVCMLISTIGLHKMGLLGGNKTEGIYKTNNTSDFDYSSLERQVTQAAKEYYYNNYPTGSGATIIVSVDTLKNYGYLVSLKDERGKDCKGYAKILQTGNCISYVRCSRYRSSGYSEEYE